MHGSYKFYLDNELVHEEKNALTTAGRSIIIKSLLGIIPNFANSIAVGVGSSPNKFDSNTGLITNNNLDFEISRTQVTGSTLNVSNENDLLVYSTTILSPDTYTIHEVGLFPSLNNEVFIGVRGSTILDFNNVDVFKKIGSASGAFMSSNVNARIGTDFLYIPNLDGQSNYLEYFSTPGTLEYLDTYSSEDVFRLAVYNPTNQSSSINFRFYADSFNYYEINFNTSSSGYFVLEKTKSSAIKYGNPTWDNISSINLWQTGNDSGIYLDGLRIDTGSYYLDTVTGMVSRAVLQTPLRKPPSVPLIVEYSLALGFNLE